eukprot:UN22414
MKETNVGGLEKSYMNGSSSRRTSTTKIRCFGTCFVYMIIFFFLHTAVCLLSLNKLLHKSCVRTQ